MSRPRKIAPGSAFAADYQPQADWGGLSESARRKAAATAVVERAREEGQAVSGLGGIGRELTVVADGRPRPAPARLCVPTRQRARRAGMGR